MFDSSAGRARMPVSDKIPGDVVVADAFTGNGSRTSRMLGSATIPRAHAGRIRRQWLELAAADRTEACEEQLTRTTRVPTAQLASNAVNRPYPAELRAGVGCRSAAAHPRWVCALWGGVALTTTATSRAASNGQGSRQPRRVGHRLRRAWQGYRRREFDFMRGRRFRRLPSKNLLPREQCR